jgi:hypothetical protein
MEAALAEPVNKQTNKQTNNFFHFFLQLKITVQLKVNIELYKATLMPKPEYLGFFGFSIKLTLPN